MRRWLKILLIVVGVLIVLLVAAVIVLKAYLTDERIRSYVVDAAQKSLNRQVSIGESTFSIFKGIVLKKVEIRESDGKAPFIRAKEFDLSFQLLPLLARQLVIGKLSLVDPEIHVRKKPDGTYNFSDIGGPKPAEKKEEEKKGLPVGLDVRHISIQNAKIDYADPAGSLKKADLGVNAELGLKLLSEKAVSSAGTIRLAVADAIMLVKNVNRSFRDVRADIRYKADMNLDAKELTIDPLDVDFMKIPLQLRGKVNYAAEPSYGIDVKIQNADLAGLRPDILALFLPEGAALGGNLSVLLNAVKKPEKGSPVALNGNITMSKVSLAYKDMRPVLDGSVKLTPDQITTEKLRLVSGPNSADISGSIKNYGTYPDANIAIRSPLLALDDLIAPAPPGSAPAAKPPQAGKEPEPADLKMHLVAALDIDKTTYKGVAITGFRSRYELKNNVFRILSLNGSTLSGTFSASGAVDLAQRGTKYSLSSNLNGIRVEEFLNAFAPKAKGKLVGVLSGKADLEGAGTLPENWKRNLKGKGGLAIRNGALRNAELSSGLLAILGLQDLKEIPIEKADSTFTIAKGLVNLKTAIASRDLTLDQTGTVGLDEKLDLGVLVKVSERLAPKVVSQSPVAKFLSGEKGWTSVPLRVTGTISKPSYGIDTRAVGRKAGEAVQKRLGEELMKRLPGGQAPPAQAPGQKPSEGAEKKSPEEVLKGLFGK